MEFAPHKHLIYSDDEFERRFQEIKFPPRWFSHEAHIRLAWIHIRKYGATQASENMCDQIKSFAEHHGAYDKFNKTITIASIHVISHFIERSQAETFVDFNREFPQIFTDFKSLLTVHYRWETLISQDARARWVEPDRMPFPLENDKMREPTDESTVE